MNVSPDLIWLCTKKNSSFLVKRNGTTLTSEPNNLLNVNAMKFSGLANKKTVDIRGAGEKITIVTKKTKDQSKPSKALRVVKMKAADPRRSAKTAAALVSDSFYRPDLLGAARARVAKYAQASVRSNKLSAGKLNVRYGRNSTNYPFADPRKEKTATKSTKQAPVADEDDDVPDLAPAAPAADAPVDDMD